MSRSPNASSPGRSSGFSSMKSGWRPASGREAVPSSGAARAMSEARLLKPGEPRSAGAIAQRRVPQSWPKDRRFRILSIDGGGIREFSRPLSWLDWSADLPAVVRSQLISTLSPAPRRAESSALGLGAGYAAADLLWPLRRSRWRNLPSLRRYSLRPPEARRPQHEPLPPIPLRP